MADSTERVEGRLVIRIDPDRKVRLRKAAEYLGQTMTTFTTRTLDTRLDEVEREMAEQDAKDLVAA